MDPAQLDSLNDPGLYPEMRGGVEIIQTHLSVVALAGDFAYKFKKAICLPFADFTTLELRRYFCEEELRLNRRLCPDIYLEVLPLRCDGGGKLQLGEGDGEIIDYALRMRRLSADRMLDVLLAENAVSASEIEGIARRMVDFHSTASRGEEIRAFGDPDKLRDFALANFEETLLDAGPDRVMSGALHSALANRTRRDFSQHLPLMRERAAAGRVVDGHGDLHARNICLTDPPAIYDCIEFNPAFRCGDTATEHAFLFMDLRFRGHAELAAVYRDAVISENGDCEMEVLLPMLVRYRAMVRAKVSAITAREPELSATGRNEAALDARDYLRLAAISAIEEDGPLWFLFCGLPASGKSSIAGALAAASRGAWPVISSDHIRKELAGVLPTERLPPECYEDTFSRRTYDELRSRALMEKGVVILDANFRTHEERRLTREAARVAGARLVILRVETVEAVVLERLASRSDNPAAVSDADRAVYEKLKGALEPPDEDEAGRILPVSGDIAADVAVDEILAAITSFT